MDLFVHVILFTASAAVIWFFAGMLIEAIHRVASRFHKSGFTVAFFILGFLTSISELSVATNATIEGVPQISVGNLIGASFVILLFIIPLLAIVGKGIGLRHTLSRNALFLALGVIILPALLVVDGTVTRGEGLLALLVYVTLLFAIKGRRDSFRSVQTIGENLVGTKRATAADGLKILVGGAFIFLAGYFLVEQGVYFAMLLGVPSSLVGLILLSIGTNVPELVIALRSILKRHKDIAFGNYLGSAATNTSIFGFLALANGTFAVGSGGFFPTALLLFGGLICFYVFARSKQFISRSEGVVLLLFYAGFLLLQLFAVAALSRIHT